MSLPEIIPSNLPQFVQNKNRSAFANSVIPSGSVLLFAESDGNGGSKLIAKNPDGSFSEVGGGGGSMDFYKCASVGTGTWTGYLASIDSTTGVWSFSDTATTGLTFDRLTPVVGHVYDEACSFEVKSYKTGLPENGLIFYLPLDADPGETDETGKALTYYNKSLITFGQTVQGIQCAKFGYQAMLAGPDFASILPNAAGTAFSISCFLSLSAEASEMQLGFDKAASANTGYITGMRDFNRYGNYWGIYTGKNGYTGTMSAYSGVGFVHFVMTFAENKVKTYINTNYQTQVAYSTTDQPFGSNTKWCPFIGTQGGSDAPNYIAAFRVYNRILSSEEIVALAAEFSPTPLS